MTVKPSMNYRMLVAFSGILAIVCLFTPFVWMEIGPLGHQYYGPTVPDVYIYGGDITGKDKSFWVMGACAGFQLIFNLLFIVLSAITLITNKKAGAALLFVQLGLLILFPLWLEIYIGSVEHNSDGADLTIHKQYGMVLYGILLGLNILELVFAFRTKNQTKANSSDF